MKHDKVTVKDCPYRGECTDAEFCNEKVGCIKYWQFKNDKN